MNFYKPAMAAFLPALHSTAILDGVCWKNSQEKSIRSFPPL